jgi:hypothetical protein
MVHKALIGICSCLIFPTGDITNKEDGLTNLMFEGISFGGLVENKKPHRIGEA